MVSVGDYDLERQVGSGASGTVWRAHSRGPVTRVVALKRLRAGGGMGDVARIRREATVLTELDHPHIVRVHEVLEDGDGIALAMQFASGGSLEELLAQRGRLSPGQVVAIAAPVAAALASAHRRGVLHGDVKPANVLFTSDGEPLLSDFGVARSLGRLTSEQITGTAEYIAPELLEGAQPHQGADVYSLGVVCYQALAGQAPFIGAGPLAVLRAADLGRHPSLANIPGVPEPLAAVVEKAISRDPAQRFASVDDMARALRGSVPPDQVELPELPRSAPLHDDGVAGGTRTFGPRPPRPDRGPVRKGMPLITALGLLTAGLVYLVRGPLAPDECPEVEAPAAKEGVQIVEGDTEGNGCTTYGIYRLEAVEQLGTERMVLRIPRGETDNPIVFGAPGDQLVLGDWDCDDIDTPALYRPTPAGEGDPLVPPGSGRVTYYNTWPEKTGVNYEASNIEEAVPNGKAAVAEAEGATCARVAVNPP